MVCNTKKGETKMKTKKITKKQLSQIPTLHTFENTYTQNIPIAAIFLDLKGRGIWYVTEYDQKKRVFFGLANLGEPELDYFSLDELESIPEIVLSYHHRDALVQSFTLARAIRRENEKA
jgi:hypothetical protein